MDKKTKHLIISCILPAIVIVAIVCVPTYLFMKPIATPIAAIIALLPIIIIIYSTKKTITEIRALKLKFLELPKKYGGQRIIVGFGTSAGLSVINTICEVCDDAIRGLEEGIGVDGARINEQKIADGLKRLIVDARMDLGIVATQINPDGVQLYQQYLRQLENIADRIAKPL